MPGFWDRLLGKTRPPTGDLQEIIEHFNAAAADEENFPSTIDPRIYHVQLIVKWFGDLSGRRVVDIGSGKGRFARVLKERYPSVSICAFDLAEVMLRSVPSGIDRCEGSMTALPFRSGVFDCAYATESLEHAVDIETAISEMCRVVRPGGSIVIIDKNAEHRGRLKTPSWEKWFERREIEQLLKRHCTEVSSKPISYWADVAPDGLFLAWLARR